MSDIARSASHAEEFVPAESVTPAAMRSVLGRFATGVVVITVGGANIHAMTANAFSSVSLDPPLVLCCVAHSAVMHGAISAERRFGVSIMSAEQRDLAAHFADKSRTLGQAQFEAVDRVTGGHTGAPLIRGALAWLECELADVHEAGTHSIFIGRVLGLANGADRAGLLFFEGAFQALPAASLA